jgi:chromosomal replication initiation ATPase DnaA
MDRMTDQALTICCKEFRLHRDDVLDTARYNRDARMSGCRAAIVGLLRRYTHMSYPDIAHELGCNNHGGVYDMGRRYAKLPDDVRTRIEREMESVK